MSLSCIRPLPMLRAPIGVRFSLRAVVYTFVTDPSNHAEPGTYSYHRSKAGARGREKKRCILVLCRTVVVTKIKDDYTRT